MTQYRLNKAETVTCTITPFPQTKVIRGREVVTWSNSIRLVPGKLYETDDKAMIDFFRSYKRDVRYNADLENRLKAYDVPYEIKYCKVCSGRVKKISYRVVEVIDE